MGGQVCGKVQSNKMKRNFTEEEIDADLSGWKERIGEICGVLALLEEGFYRNRKSSRKPMVVLVGAPNAGKSSLINSLKFNFINSLKLYSSNSHENELI